MVKIGFSLQSENKFQIDTTPLSASTYVDLSAGIDTFDPQWNDEVDQTAYLDGGGFAESEVTGGQLIITFEGHRKYGDPAQDYIASLLLNIGEGRKTNLKWTDPKGDVFLGKVTIANIVVLSGDANTKSVFSFEAHFNGKPTLVSSGADSTPPTVTVTPVDAATGVATNSNVVWLFSEAIQSTLVNDANFFVTKSSDGTQVAGSLTISGDAKTVTFTPTVALTAATPYVAYATRNIKDIAGNALATNSITNFTTA